MQDQNLNPQSTRSSFVTVLAWIFIALAAWTTLISLLQNIMVNTVFPVDLVSATTKPGADPIPPFFEFMLRNFRLLVLGFLIASSGTLLAAIGLLKRKNWARLAFIGILALDIVWNIGGIVLQQVVFPSMMAIPSKAPPDFQASFERMAFAIRVFSAIFALGISVLFAWLIKRLLSPSIRAEFT